uniref:Uncharacterized protein n=1 Tax=Rhizophagus irregularis (strain DAOM 181602 / DAOM 197198 / MUCL 43194) TaxID=747089 RepID=U9TDE7_RHIID
MVATIKGDPRDSLRFPVLVVTVCVGEPSQLPLGVHNYTIGASKEGHMGLGLGTRWFQDVLYDNPSKLVSYMMLTALGCCDMCDGVLLRMTIPSRV